MFLKINLEDVFHRNISDPADEIAPVRMPNGRVGFYPLSSVFCIEAIKVPDEDRVLWDITLTNGDNVETYDDVAGMLAECGVVAGLKPA